MCKKPKQMPVFGVGPLFVITCLILTILGLVLANNPLLQSGKLPQCKVFFIAVGLLLILLGVLLWVYSVLIQKINKEVTQWHLLTTGVYAIVRNPVYSAFIALFSGMLCMAYNLWLLVLPIFFWGYASILMKSTEEKWLYKAFGEAYTQYCKKVNRLLPWFPKK
ncbi:MAG: isoprenylcysteine carboxylmethyltransferase family protein [Eubacteriales bacterium]|nr:isoprenylcysteine carboxylmethyltransferase family protein [Eubacteriales bacterium]